MCSFRKSCFSECVFQAAFNIADLHKLCIFVDILVNVKGSDPIYVYIIIRRHKTKKDNLPYCCLSKHSLITNLISATN